MALSHKHLTSVYRPQNFSEVVGQETVCRILSKAAEEDKVAPAYMFSGTRGVGKTTLARILAKTINCASAPTHEPCNQCSFCRQITAGRSLDILEIDGASHTGVDNVRKLNEEIGYAPLECRYKVIIIDEAHMLSKSAFNALLKTLEEPPAHAVFILATTEPHKFPATIVSRCQHYTFKRIPQKVMQNHLASILEQEGLQFDQEALSVISRKGNGSLRDSMSLLSQVLVLGENRVVEQTVREILGVAGHEFMQSIIRSLADKDCLGLVEQVHQFLNQGLDLGFFLQELGAVWRNLFLLKQTGEKGLEIMEISQEEARTWLEWSRKLSISQIHASWQMTLEGQRRIMQSPDPALSLELLLLNIAHINDLLPIGQVEPDAGGTPAVSGSSDLQKEQEVNSAQNRPIQTGAVSEENKKKVQSEARRNYGREEDSWEGFLAYVQEKGNSKNLPNLNLTRARINGSSVKIYCPAFLGERLEERERFACLQNMLQDYFQEECQIEIIKGSSGETAEPADLKKKVLQDPLVESALNTFQARVIDIKPKP